MNTCDTCKWWEPSELGFYDMEGNEQETHQCESPKLLKFVKPEIDGASLMDGSYYKATLHTGPKFGCLHHEAKETSREG